jgi:hypothetical protein
MFFFISNTGTDSYLMGLPVFSSSKNYLVRRLVQNLTMSVSGLWIRIRMGSGFSDFVDPDPYWESGSKGNKVKKFQWKNALFSIF